MARLVTCGFECQTIDSQAGRAEGQFYLNGGAPVIETSLQRSGAACLKCTTSGDAAQWTTLGGTLDHWLYARVYVRVSGNPTTSANLLSFTNTTPATAGNVFLVNAGSGTPPRLRLRSKATSSVGSDSAFLVPGNWHKVEAGIYVPTAGNGKLYLWLDDTLVASSDSVDIFNVAIGQFNAGTINATPGNSVSVYLDDVAVNDDTGAAQNGRCGEGRIILLRPTADYGQSGFTAGAGGTTNLYDAVDNIPPVGVVAGSATNTSQIKSGINNTTDYYEATLEAYTTRLASADLVTVVQAITNAGDDHVTGQVNFVSSVTANPADSEATAITSVAAAGTYPTAWQTGRGPTVYAPSLTLGTGPRVKVRRTSSNAFVLHVDHVGLYVEYVQAAVLPLGTSAAVATTSLLVTAQTALALAASGGLAAALLSLTAQTQVPLAASGGQSTATLSLSAQTQIPLDASAGVSSTSLALKAQTQLPLGTSVATSTATLALSAQTTLPLNAATATSSASLALTGQTQLPLGAAAAQSSASLSLSAQTQVPLGISTGQSATSLTLGAQTTLPLGSASGVSSTSLALTAQTTVPLNSAAGLSGASLALTAQTGIALDPAAGSSTTSLAVTATLTLPLAPSVGVSTASLALSAPTSLELQSAGISSATLAVSAQTRIALGASAGSSSASLALRATTRLSLGTSAGVSTGTLDLTTQTLVLGAPAPLFSAGTIGRAQPGFATT